jgi:hypothetical protein
MLCMALIACMGDPLVLSQEASAEEIAVAAASDLNFAIKDVIA